MTRPPPPVPVPGPLGTIWKPEAPSAEGSLAPDLRKLMDGLIRVEKTCRSCGRLFEGWMFMAMYREQVRSGAIDPDHPHYAGEYRACDDCVRVWENRQQITRIENDMERFEHQWEKTTTLTRRVPIVVGMVGRLKQLVDLVEFGSSKFERYGEQLNVLTDWLQENRPPAEKLPGALSPAEMA